MNLASIDSFLTLFHARDAKHGLQKYERIRGEKVETLHAQQRLFANISMRNRGAHARTQEGTSRFRDRQEAKRKFNAQDVDTPEVMYMTHVVGPLNSVIIDTLPDR